MTHIVDSKESIQYDGTNGDYICDTWLYNVTKISDNGTTLVWENSESQVSADLNDYVLRSGTHDNLGFALTPTEYAGAFYELPAPVAYTLKLAAGYAITPTILTTASANVAVNLDAAMTGTGYEFTAVLAGAASLLGGLEITGAVATDSDTVTVTVHNTGLVSLAGATVIVAAAQLVQA